VPRDEFGGAFQHSVRVIRREGRGSKRTPGMWPSPAVEDSTMSRRTANQTKVEMGRVGRAPFKEGWICPAGEAG
jgi:hypothetical protein